MAFVGVSDLDRAERFYGETLGFELDDQRPFALVASIGGTELRITEVEQVRAAPYTVLGWGLDDIDATVDLLTLRGIEFTRYEGMGQDARGIWTAPSGARIAWFLDPDGNNLSLTEFT
jgi:catechol 2,3-dioxygenase-like lactoylglutathione lyase family enzyme